MCRFNQFLNDHTRNIGLVFLLIGAKLRGTQDWIIISANMEFYLTELFCSCMFLNISLVLGLFLIDHDMVLPLSGPSGGLSFSAG